MILLLLDCVLGEHKGPLHSVAVNVLHSLRVSKGQAYHPMKLALLFFSLSSSYCVTYMKLILPVVLNFAYGIKAWNKSSAISCRFNLPFYQNKGVCVLVDYEFDPQLEESILKRQW